MQLTESFSAKILVLLVPTCFLISIGFTLIQIYLANSSKSWPSTQGKITDSKIYKKPNGRQSYFAQVKYTYKVDDVRYEGSRISFGFTGGSKSTAQHHRNQYRKEREVSVYYHPSRSGLATLETELPSTTSSFLLFLSVLFLLAVSFIY